MLKTKNPGILRAIGVLQRLSMSNSLRLRYEAYLKRVRDDHAWRAHVWKEAEREGMEKGREEGRKEGKVEGREEGRKEGKTEGREEGRKEGKAEGKAQGKAENVLSFLNEYGRIPDDLRARILSQRDVEKLDEWVKIAARSQSVGEFKEKAGIKTKG